MRVFTAGKTRSAIAKEKEALIFEVEGKPIVLTTTATTTPTEEILNRFVIVKLDESEEQTRRTFDIEEEEYSEEIKEFLKNLKSYEVEIPFKKKISNVFPAKKVRSRRDYQRFLDWIRAVAVFHQDERRGHTTNTIKAELEDYDIARECYMNAFKGVADIPLKPVDKKIVDVLEKAEEPIIVSKILEFIEGYLSKPSLYTHLKNLKNKGIIDEFEDKEAFGFTKNVPVTKYALSEEFKDKNPIKLPNSVDL